MIIGPADTPFEDGTFRLVMQFEEQYPNKPPSVKFISQMFHPNVYATGELCLDILQNRWSPTYDVAAVLTSIQRSVLPTLLFVLVLPSCNTCCAPHGLRCSRCIYCGAAFSAFLSCARLCSTNCMHSLLNDPNTGSPANVEASNLYKDNRKEYAKRVREVVEKSWED